MKDGAQDLSSHYMIAILNNNTPMVRDNTTPMSEWPHSVTQDEDLGI